MQAANTLGAEILVNNSYSGTTLFSPFSENNEVGYLSRPYNLHDNTGDNAGEEPDIIAVYMGTNDISYHQSRLGTYDDINFDTLIRAIGDGYAYQTPETSAEAYAIMIHKIITTYENAEVYCFTALPRGKQSVNDASLTETLNNSITKIAEHFGCFTVDLYTESGLSSDERVYSRYLSDSYLHPNKKGMDAIESVFLTALYKNSKYAADKDIFNIEYNLKNVMVNEGLKKCIPAGDELNFNLTKLQYGELNIQVTMNGEDITSTCVNGNIVSIPSVEGDISVAANITSTLRSFKNYRFERKNNTLVNISQNENSGNNITVLNNGTFKLQNTATLYYDTPWTVIFRIYDSTDNILPLSTDAENGFSFVLDAENNILGLCDIKNPAEIYGISLKDLNINIEEPHTYKIVNSFAVNGTNTFTVFVDNKEIGIFDSHFINGAIKDKDISTLFENDFSFNIIGSQNPEKLEYLQIWGNDIPINHTHIWGYPQETSPKCEEPGSTTYTCDCGEIQTLPDIPATGHTEDEWIISKPTSAIEAGEEYKECIICNKVTQTRTIPQLKCEKPVITGLTNTDTGVQVAWNNVTGADSYRVYRHLKGGKWVYLCTTTERTYIDTDVENGYWYYYTVRAVNEAGYSDYYTSVKSIQFLNAPVFRRVQNAKQGITISWNSVHGAQGYYLYKKTGNGYYKYYCRVNSTSYTDKNVANGVTYSYRIKAVRNKTVSGFYYNGVTLQRLGAPALKSPVNTDSGIKVLWNRVNGASGYLVYRIEGGYWKYIGKTTATSFTDVNVTSGKTYTYTIKAYNTLGQQSVYNTGVACKRLTTPYLYDTDSLRNGIKVKWYSVNGAGGYYVYRKTANGSWSYIGKTTKNDFTDKNAKKGVNYTYTVKAYSGAHTSTYNARGITAKR